MPTSRTASAPPTRRRCSPIRRPTGPRATLRQGTRTSTWSRPARGISSSPPRKLFILVTDIQGSALIPNGTPQVRVPSTYNLSANVQAAPALAGRAGSILEGGFAFKNTGPNPANPQAKLIYVLPANGGAGYGVKLRIFDVNGRLVRSLVNRQLPAGAHIAVWDGTDDAGRGVSSGHYYARIDAGTYSEKVGVTILK